MHRSIPTGSTPSTTTAPASPDHPRSTSSAGRETRRWRAARMRGGSTSPTATDAAETLDVFPGAPQADAPVLVFIHGGWWRSLDKRDHSFVAPSFIARRRDGGGAELRVCARRSTIETIALQMAHALAWVWRHAARFGGDPSRIVVAGHSAGGHLAAMLLSCGWRAGRRPAGAAGRRRRFDLGPLRPRAAAPDAFLKADLRLTPTLVRSSARRFFRPRRRSSPRSAPDESDEFLRQNQLIRDVWGPTAVPVRDRCRPPTTSPC